MRNIIRRQGGQSIVEFAVVVPAFLALMLFTIFSGMLISDYLALKHVAVNAARVVDNSGTEPSISTANKAVFMKYTTFLVCDNLSLNPEKVDDNPDFVRVIATADITNETVKKWFGDTISAASAAEYRK